MYEAFYQTQPLRLYCGSRKVPDMQEGLPVTVRSAGLPDADTIARFNMALALETENKRLDAAIARRGVEAALQHPDHARYFIADLNGAAVGQCMVTFEWSDWRAGLFWWIQSVYVHPNHRGRGVFKQLFEHVRRQARDGVNVCGLRLYVEAHNETAITAYRRLGMTPSGHVVYELDWSDEGNHPSHHRD